MRESECVTGDGKKGQGGRVWGVGGWGGAGR